jgi:hypothetical protein
MHPLILVLVILASGLLVFFAGPRLFNRAAAQSDRPPAVTPGTPAPAQPPVPLAAGKLTREQLDQRLLDLQKSNPVIQNERGAMCYDVSAPPQHVDYVCPKDGSRTQYPLKQSSAYQAARDAAGIRTALKGITEMDLSLDESELCRKCNPAIKDPKLILVVKVPGSPKEIRYRGLTYEDVTLIREFLSGQTVHRGDRDQEEPLKNHLNQIRGMLGLDAGTQAK